MLSTWDHNDYLKNDYIESVWYNCEKITQEHFYHVGAKEENRNPVIEALLINYKTDEKQNKIVIENKQLSFFNNDSA